jgi:hypothetical protein
LPDALKNLQSYILPFRRVIGAVFNNSWARSLSLVAMGIAVGLFVSQPRGPYRWDEGAAIPATPQQGELLWNDVVGLFDAFSGNPKPCKVKLTATQETMNSRNILRRIIMNVCEIVDDQRDQSLPTYSIDNPRKAPEYGLVVRWNRSFDPGQRTFGVFDGLFRNSVRAGDKMPEGSPPNLIWIDVGTGYPWKR